jgi:PilZ domain
VQGCREPNTHHRFCRDELYASKGAVGLAAIMASVYKRNWNAWHSAVVMDKRDTQRQKVVRVGTISFDGSGIDCLVRNMSVGGANLEVESQIGIPSSFDLVINVEHSNHRCHVVWRKARRIGIAFD